MEVRGFKLELQEFCRYCSEFEAEVDREDFVPLNGKEKRTFTRISCKNKHKCDAIAERIEERFQSERV